MTTARVIRCPRCGKSAAHLRAVVAYQWDVFCPRCQWTSEPVRATHANAALKKIERWVLACKMPRKETP